MNWIKNKVTKLFSIENKMPLVPHELPAPTQAERAPETTNKRMYSLAITNQRRLRRDGLDMAALSSALMQAEYWERQDKEKLEAIYRMVREDTHMTGLLMQRESEIITQEFRIAVDGQVSNKYDKLFKCQWFAEFIHAVMDKRLEGNVLIELGQVEGDTLTHVFKYPLRYFNAIEKCIYPRGDRHGKSYKYNVPEYADSLIELGEPYDLGDLRKAVPYVIWKNYCMGNFATYTDLFGIPPMLAKTSARDINRQKDLQTMLQNMRSAYGMVIDTDEEIITLGDSKDGSQIFSRLVDVCNKELSKLILGQTMTSEAGTGYAQASVHANVASVIEEAELKYLEWVINEELIPRLQNLGLIKEKEVTFTYPLYELVKPEQLQQLGQEFLSRLDIEKMAEKYNIPITELPEEAEASASSRIGEFGVGGVQGLLQIQQSVAAGQLPVAAGVATIVNVFGFDEATAKQLLQGMGAGNQRAGVDFLPR